MSKALERFPEPIEAAIAEYARKDLVRRVAASRVVLLDAPGRAPLVLKIAAGLAVEAERLRWLAGRLPVPEVVAFAAGGEREYLVMTRLGGVDGTGAHEGMALDAFVRALGEALREIHAVR